MVSTPEGCTNNIPMTPNPYVSTKNTSAGKSLRQFSDILDVKQMTDVHGLCAAKEKCKKIKTGNVLCSNITKRRVHTKINQKVRESLYN